MNHLWRLLFLFVLALTGCSSKPVTRLRFMFWADDGEFSKLKQMVDSYEHQNPGVKIDLLRVESKDIYIDEFLAERALGKAPDVFETDLFLFPTFMEKGWMKDLRSKVDDLFDFQPRLTECFFRDGKLWAVPASCSTLVLYYNRQKFDRSGLPFPASWDWSDLKVAAERLTIAEGKDGAVIQYGIELDPGVRTWAAFLWQNGGELADPETGRWVIGAPHEVERNAAALQFYADLIHDSRAAPARSALQSQAGSAAFENQLAAMTIAGRTLAGRLRPISSLSWDVCPLPRNRNPATTLTVDGYGISSTTKNFEAAWKFLRFLTGPTSQTRLTMNGWVLPSRVSVSQSKVFLDFPGTPAINNKAFVDSLYYARPLPVSGRWPQIEKILAEETDLLFSAGKLSARECLIAAQVRIDKLMGVGYETVPDLNRPPEPPPKKKKKR